MAFLVATLICVMFGALLGLIPYFLGVGFGKPGLGKLGLLTCTLTGILWFIAYIWYFSLLSLISCVGFSIAVFVKQYDFPWPQKQKPQPQPQPQQQVVYQSGTGALNVVCLSGPLRGQVYGIGSGGIKFGRDTSCAVRFPNNTPGVSRVHCAIRWQQGVPVLVDLNSTHGTYLGSGQKLPPQSPVEIAAGSRFYLGDTNCLFQITVA